MSGSDRLRLVLGSLAVLTAPLLAQAAQASAPAAPTVAITGGRLLLDPGAAPQPGVLLIVDGRISAAGPDVSIPPDARQIDASGHVVAPAWIDAGNAGLVDPASLRAGSSSPKDQVADMLEFANPRPRHALLRAGVGAVYCELMPGGRGYRGPTGAIGLVHPEGGELIDPVAGVTFRLGGRSNNMSTTTLHSASFKNVTGALDGAKRYKKTWDKYAEDLKEYEKKLEEWKKKPAGEKGGEKNAKPEKKKEEPKDPTSAPRRGRRSLPPGWRDWPQEKKREWFRSQMANRRAGGGSSEETKDDGAASKDGRPKKPLTPKVDPGDAAMVRVLDGEIPLRVEAHWKEDILHAVKEAKERKLRLVLLGATEAWRCLEEIKDVDATVVIGPNLGLGTDTLESVGMRHDLPVLLAEGGIPFAFMTAGEAGFRHDSVALIACLAVSAGLSQEQALVALTTDAARALGREKDLGGLAPGRIAAVQILSGDPLAPETRVEQMILGSEVIAVHGEGR